MKYALEPVWQQREWTLDAAKTRLASAQSELAMGEVRALRLEEHRDREARVAADAWQRVRDPRSQGATLAYLSFLQRQLEDAQREVATLRDRVSAARAACQVRQRELEVIEEHRKQSLKDAQLEVRRQSAVQADAEWNSRSHLRAGDAS
jgi:hypothetical protein